MPRQDLIQVRRGTAAQWTSANPTLDSGEFGFETDTNKLKCGDGSTAWNSLDYISGGSGAGDMLQSVYDPTNVEGDAFDMENMVEGSTNKIFTATERTKLSGIEDNADVTDATNVASAGATMNTDADVSANVWVIDEDDMASDSATKVPTQQSVKAYVDANAHLTDEEIETAYNNQVPQIDSGEIAAGTETTVRRFSPADVKAMIDEHASSGDAVFSVDSSGSVIKFDEPRTYGNISLLEGSISFDFTDAKFMCPVFLIHRSSSPLALPSGSVIAQGFYKTDEINYIQLVYINDTKVLVYFNNIDSTNSDLVSITFTGGGSGAGVTVVDDNNIEVRGATIDFKQNYIYTSQTFAAGEGVEFKATPVLSSTTVRLFAAFVDSENSNFALNTICGFTIRAGELRVWNGSTTDFVMSLTDVNATFTVSIDNNNKCRFTSEVDGDYVSLFTVPDGSKFQIWFADEDGTFGYPSESANDIDLFQVFMTLNP